MSRCLEQINERKWQPTLRTSPLCSTVFLRMNDVPNFDQTVMRRSNQLVIVQPFDTDHAAQTMCTYRIKKREMSLQFTWSRKWCIVHVAIFSRRSHGGRRLTGVRNGCISCSVTWRIWSCEVSKVSIIYLNFPLENARYNQTKFETSKFETKFETPIQQKVLRSWQSQSWRWECSLLLNSTFYNNVRALF